MGGYKTSTCLHCGRPFVGRQWRHDNGEVREPKFCSRKCYQQSRHEWDVRELGVKRCCRCKQVKPVANYDKHTYGKDGYKSECKSCRRIYNQNVYNAIKDTLKFKAGSLRLHLRHRYGISVEYYNELVQKQRGLCAICQQPPPKAKRLHVDHCHETNRIRGLLCIHCNRALGSLGDNLEGVMRAVRYLASNNLTRQQPEI